jgi:hypothetical protein
MGRKYVLVFIYSPLFLMIFMPFYFYHHFLRKEERCKWFSRKWAQNIVDKLRNPGIPQNKFFEFFKNLGIIGLALFVK